VADSLPDGGTNVVLTRDVTNVTSWFTPFSVVLTP